MFGTSNTLNKICKLKINPILITNSNRAVTLTLNGSPYGIESYSADLYESKNNVVLRIWSLYSMGWKWQIEAIIVEFYTYFSDPVHADEDRLMWLKYKILNLCAHGIWNICMSCRIRWECDSIDYDCINFTYDGDLCKDHCGEVNMVDIHESVLNVLSSTLVVSYHL